MTSCSDKVTRCFVCEESQSLKVAEFVSDNVHKANNMSDEEMEDVIRELRNTGVKLYCKQVFLPCTWDNIIIWSRVNKKDSETYHPYIN